MNKQNGGITEREQYEKDARLMMSVNERQRRREKINIK